MSDLAIVWFRRDFRLADNPALDAARSDFGRVLPVYVHDPEALGDWAPGAASRWWLHHALVDLRDRLSDRGAPLVIRSGGALVHLRDLVRKTGAKAVYWNRLYEPGYVERDKEIKSALSEEGVDVKSFRASVLFEPWELLHDGKPYQVFTPYWKRTQKEWRPVSTRPEPRELAAPDDVPGGDAVEDLALLPDHDWGGKLAEAWEPGERAGRRRLEHFADEAVADYEKLRDRPAVDGTSRLSPYLHFGHVSPAQVVEALEPSGELPTGKGTLGFVRELAWREFSALLLFHAPRLPDRALKEKFRNFPWRAASEYAEDLEAWKRGRTGVPMVDAGMRQLWQTGWMHNRVRMVVASYLTKNLLIPWQEGERWFWDTLVDADLANNSQGWQWTAGCGADAAPYFRIFNPERQAERFDPEGEYIRRWVPELEGLERKEMESLEEERRDELGYARPLVDLKGSRERALDAYAEIKD
ncbi:MAG: deoxyribodipyrimidine photo-lyase [Wenzhouxiangellaceae bacterium]|nr:deoxyribodipyrimidine photo-lyase [Wenzhouxiangellaceae bacterium]